MRGSLHKILLLGALLLSLAAPVWSQGYAGLGSGGDAYAQVTPGRSFTFPQDHLAHPEFRIEWWYVTANLEAADGTPMGAQWTLFRQAGAPSDAGTGWQSAQVWMGHAAVTTPEAHHLAETFARGGIGQAGVSGPPFAAWIDDWAMQGTGPGFEELRVTASGDAFSYDLTLTAQGPLVLQGDQGYSVKSDAGQASYYYSQPFFTVTGAVVMDGRSIEVTGRAWLDREWSSQPLTSTQTGWDWFALHLPGGEKLMAYQLRDDRGPVYVPGTWIAADGTPTPLLPGQIFLTPLQQTQVAGLEIPTHWQVRVPDRGIDLVTEPVNPQSYMRTAFPYWEGPIRFTGSHEGMGYLEMTGY